MSDRDDEIARRAAANVADYMENGPGLRWSYSTWVIAKDTQAGKMLLGGLGGMGVGRMWIGLYERDDPTFADAPEQSWAESRELGGGVR